MVLCGAVIGSIQPAESALPLAPLQQARERRQLAPLTADPRLDAIARRYAQAAVDERCLCLPSTSTARPEDQLLTDVVSALGVREVSAGIVIDWNVAVERAVAASIGRPGLAGALLDPTLSLVGVGSVVIPAGAPWFEPPPSGEGPEIELTGYQLVVIVTAGFPR